MRPSPALLLLLALLLLCFSATALAEGFDASRDDIQKFGVEKLATDLLPVKDSLEAALAASPGLRAARDGGGQDAQVIEKFRANGFQGFLIGENFMKKEYPGLAFEQFVIDLQRAG